VILRSQETVFEGRVFSVTRDTVLMPNGRELAMEIVRHPESVVLLPMPDRSHIFLVRQYRYAIGRWIWELPAGSVEPGEHPDSAARRECHEEVGLEPHGIERLAASYPSPGFCTETMIFYRLTDLRAPSLRAAQDEDEQLDAKVFTLSEARALARAEPVGDMKTVVGLMLIE
jgi:ADP-ribose pyrophosphatase